eukprot:PhM_4_TR15690/c2_g3_i1/m.54438
MSLVEQQRGMTDLVEPNEECGADMGTYVWTQADEEVVVRIPMPSGATSKQVDVVITPTTLKIGFKGQPGPVLCGKLYKPVKDSESMWMIEEKTTLVVNLQKSNLKYEEWWPHVVEGERQIDMQKFKPPSKHMRDLDAEAQATIQKMMFDQEQKRKGMPTSEELQMQDMMAKMPPPPSS